MTDSGSGDTTDQDQMANGEVSTPREAYQTETADQVPEEVLDEIEQERRERLDPDNRPETAEVDNTDREFDVPRGQFTDSDHDDDLGPYNDPTAPDGEMEA